MQNFMNPKRVPLEAVQSLKCIRADKVGSSTVNLNLPDDLPLLPPSRPRMGDVVVVRALTDNATYNRLELTSGRLARVNPHDVIVGVLGPRQALKGFVGEVPDQLTPSCRLHLLNLGGVIGRCVGRHHQLGWPIEVELLGMAARDGRVLNIGDFALKPARKTDPSIPLVLITGTSMNSGKTQVANELIKHFAREGYKVGAGKVSGVACLRDTLDMQDHGAAKALSFLDCGYPSTVKVENIAPLAKTIVTHLAGINPDLIVLELGDGVLGGYNVDSLFDDEDFMAGVAAVTFCAGDFVGAWGGIQLLKEKGVEVAVISGEATDSPMGVEFIEKKFGVPAANALNGGEKLYSLVLQRIKAWRKPE